MKDDITLTMCKGEKVLATAVINQGFPLSVKSLVKSRVSSHMGEEGLVIKANFVLTLGVPKDA